MNLMACPPLFKWGLWHSDIQDTCASLRVATALTQGRAEGYSPLTYRSETFGVCVLFDFCARGRIL